MRNVYAQSNISRGATSFVISPTLYDLYLNNASISQGVYLALFADGTSMYTTECQDAYVLRMLQRGLNSVESWCER
jgi:hypothetical protein